MIHTFAAVAPAESGASVVLAVVALSVGVVVVESSGGEDDDGGCCCCCDCVVVVVCGDDDDALAAAPNCRWRRALIFGDVSSSCFVCGVFCST